MAEAAEPTHLLDVCSQKLSEFMFNAEHKCLMWLREIEEEAMKMFDSNLSAEPALMPKTPSQKRHRKKKRSSFFKDDNKELTRKRLSKRRSGVKAASFNGISLSKEDLEVAASCKTNLPTKETSEAQCDKTVMQPFEERALGVDGEKNTEIKGKKNEEVSSIPVLSDDHIVDKIGTTQVAGISDVLMVLADPFDPARTRKDWDASRLSTSTPKPSLHKKPAGGEELFLAQQVDNVVQEGAQDLKDSRTSGGSRSGHCPSNRPHKNRRVSLVEKYSLTSKRTSMIRKSISKSIAKKKATPNSSSTSSRVSCHSSIEMLMNDETGTNGPSLLQNAQADEKLKMLQKTSCTLDVPSLAAICAAENPDQPDLEHGKVCSEESLAMKMTGSQVTCGSEDSAQSSQPHEQNIRRQSYKQALDELSTPQPTKDEDPSPCSNKTLSVPANKVLSPTGPARITRPFKNFFQSMQKSQLLKAPGSPGPGNIMKSLVKYSIPATNTKEKERQRLESLRKKQEAEQQRKQKVEEEKKRRVEEMKLKREERLRKALQARERVEQMEEEKRKRMEQKFSQHEERTEKVREEKMAEEKIKRKVSMKKMWDTEVRKPKVLQVFQEEEQQKLQEQPEKWKTVGEIKKMLEHNNAKQAKERHHGQQEKEKLVKQKELAVVKEEEESQKEEKSPANLEPLPQEKTAKQVEAVPAAGKWLNITAQKSAISTSNHMTSRDLEDSKSLQVNPNDYGMDLNSDDSTDDESQPRRSIPSWATGLQLNEAVTYQYYNPPDIDTFFGQIFSPKLEDIFYKSKPRYFKRTSSAVWQSPPLSGTKTALRASSSAKKC